MTFVTLKGQNKILNSILKFSSTSRALKTVSKLINQPSPWLTVPLLSHGCDQQACLASWHWSAMIVAPRHLIQLNLKDGKKRQPNLVLWKLICAKYVPRFARVNSYSRRILWPILVRSRLRAKYAESASIWNRWCKSIAGSMARRITFAKFAARVSHDVERWMHTSDGTIARRRGHSRARFVPRSSRPVASWRDTSEVIRVRCRMLARYAHGSSARMGTWRRTWRCIGNYLMI